MTITVRLLSCLVLLGLAGAMAGLAGAQVTQASAPRSISPSYSSFESALFAEARRRVPEGRYDWGSPSSASGGGTISLGREYPSSDPGERCGACSDPCRRFRLSFRSSRGFGEYVGRMCMNPATASWSVRALDEEEWTALEQPKPVVVVREVERPPPPPVERTETVAIDPSKQVLTVDAMLKQMTPNLASLGYASLDQDADEAAFAAYARDHEMEITLAALSSRERQNEVLDRLDDRARAISGLDRAGFMDDACQTARSVIDELGYPIAVCATTGAQ
ncbi:MAG: hypothetical protein AAFR41_04945 [Pseudomonadota bacterium]